jgi:hypothetical protein
VAVLGGVALAFPAGGNGEQPFAGWLLRDCLLVTAVVALLPVGRAVRTGALLTALLLVGAYVVPSAVGSNASRMPLLFAAPAGGGRCPAAAVPLALRSSSSGSSPRTSSGTTFSALDASRTTPEYYAPLLAALDAEPLMRTHRVEIVEPRDHWHAARVAPHHSLARGWQRQADVERTTPLYRPEPLSPAPLTAQAYRAWLDEYAVAVVAVAPDAPVDFASVQERTLVLAGLPYLEDAGRHGAWQVFRVRNPLPWPRALRRWLAAPTTPCCSVPARRGRRPCGCAGRRISSCPAGPRGPGAPGRRLHPGGAACGR